MFHHSTTQLDSRRGHTLR